MLKVKFYCTHLKLGSRRSNQNFKHFEFLLYKKKSKTPKTTCSFSTVYIHMVNLSTSCFLTMLIRNSLLVGDYRKHKQINKDWFNKLCFVNKQHQLRMPRPPITA